MPAPRTVWWGFGATPASEFMTALRRGDASDLDTEIKKPGANLDKGAGRWIGQQKLPVHIVESRKSKIFVSIFGTDH